MLVPNKNSISTMNRLLRCSLNQCIAMVHWKETQALITWYWSKFLDKELKWCICHIDIHDKTTLLEKMYLGRDNMWSQSRSWTTNFLPEIPTDQGGLRRVKSAGDWLMWGKHGTNQAGSQQARTDRQKISSFLALSERYLHSCFEKTLWLSWGLEDFQ